MSVFGQVEILNEIVQIMHRSAGGVYDDMRCEFDYEAWDYEWSVGSKFSFSRRGSHFSELLDDPAEQAPELVRRLHRLMYSHTGGAWKGFVLEIDSDGTAHTKFDY